MEQQEQIENARTEVLKRLLAGEISDDVADYVETLELGPADTRLGRIYFPAYERFTKHPDFQAIQQRQQRQQRQPAKNRNNAVIDKQTSEEPPTVRKAAKNAKLTALLKKQIATDAAKYWTTAEELEKTSAVMEELIPADNLDELNADLKRNKKREVSYRDVASIWLAHRHNVRKNADHSSPIKGLIGLTKTLVKAGLVEAVPVRLHCCRLIEWFIALGLTVRVTEPAPKQAARYTLPPNEYGI